MLGGINRRNQFSSLVVTDEVMLDFSPYFPLFLLVFRNKGNFSCYYGSVEPKFF
jgi:hypothetical protein